MKKLTLTVPGDLINKAKHKTFDEGTSISRVVTACLREYVGSDAPSADPSPSSSTDRPDPTKDETGGR